jgi:hypothetical protein
MHDKKTILLLGATGNTGRFLAGLLLKLSTVQLKVASRSGRKAADLACQLNRKFPGERVQASVVEAASLDIMAKALSGVDLLVAASSTSAFVETTAHACLSAGTDYFDLQFSGSKIMSLRSLEPEIRRAGSCFITDGGFHPGLPAALIRWAAGNFDELRVANVGSVIKIDWKGLKIAPETAAEMVREFRDYDNRFYGNKRWKKGRIDIVIDHVRMDFGPPFGRCFVIPMFLEELRGLPQSIPSLSDAGFFVGSFNWFTDWFMLPLGMLWHRLSPKSAERTFSRWLLWSLAAFSRPPFGTRLKLEAAGTRCGKPYRLELLLAHPDGYFFTAASAAAALLQWLDGSNRRTGLFTQGEWVEPRRLLSDLDRMDIAISCWPQNMRPMREVPGADL